MTLVEQVARALWDQDNGKPPTAYLEDAWRGYIAQAQTAIDAVDLHLARSMEAKFRDVRNTGHSVELQLGYLAACESVRDLLK